MLVGVLAFLFRGRCDDRREEFSFLVFFFFFVLCVYRRFLAGLLTVILS